MSFRRTLLNRFSRPSKSAAPAKAFTAIEGLEERVLFALATASGGSGFSGTLSTNPTIRQQQLICDPIEPKQGSTSVSYDPSMVSLTGFTPGPGYNNKWLDVDVQVRKKNGKVFFQNLKQFLKKKCGVETGYAQVSYRISGQSGQLAPPTGFNVVDEGGVTGVDTHAFMFTLCPGVSTAATVDYQVFAAKNKEFGNNKADYLITNDGTNTRITADQLTPAFISTNPTPVIDSTGGPYVVKEGQPLTLSASAAGNGTNLSFAWDINADGTIDATGASPTISAAQLQTLGLGDGPSTANVRLTVSSLDQTVSADTTLTIENAAPTVTAQNTEAFLGTTMKLHVGATDASSADQAAGFTYLVDWGDYTPVQTFAASAGNGSGLVLSHDYNAVGVRDVTVRAVDKDGGISAPCHVTATVSGAGIRKDPFDDNLRALAVVGTSGNDTISFNPCPNGALEAFINGQSYGVFSNFGRVLAYGLAGNDTISLHDATGVLFGNAGDDVLTAGNYNVTLVGGDGTDSLTAGNGRNVLIGGAGADTILAGTNDDLLVAGRTDYDAGSDNDVFAITAIANEWASGAAYADRIAHLGGATGGVNGQVYLRAGVEVTDDNVVDHVNGNAGQDWFFLKTAGSAIDLADNVTGETIAAL